MTTIVGIKADEGKKGVILASDLSGTESSWIAQGDMAYREQTRREMKKIYVDDSKKVAVCMAGTYDAQYVEFLSKILRGKIDLERVVKESVFPELKELNELRWEGKIPNNENINGLLLATRFGNPELYTCWPLGKVEKRDWTAIGSGSQFAIRYIRERDKLIPAYLGISEGIEVAVGSLNEALADIYTGGLNLAITTEEDIYEFGAEIQKAIESAKRRKIEEIKKKFA